MSAKKKKKGIYECKSEEKASGWNKQNGWEKSKMGKEKANSLRKSKTDECKGKTGKWVDLWRINVKQNG